MNAKQEIKKIIIELQNGNKYFDFQGNEMDDEKIEVYKHCLSLIEQEDKERKCENCIESIVCHKKILTEYADENGDIEKVSIIPITSCSNFKHKDNK